MVLGVLLLGAATILLLVPSLTERYVRRLPDAPWCPGCRALTRGQAEGGVMALLLPALAATVRGECQRCGWRGRMRLRLAPEGARGG